MYDNEIHKIDTCSDYSELLWRTFNHKPSSCLEISTIFIRSAISLVL